jgi:putative SOS response-associated peptidase YedK
MCGRFVQSTDPDLYADYFSILDPPSLEPRYNIAPTDPVRVVISAPDGSRRLEVMRWGLVPSWAKDASVGARMFNARAETVADKPAYRAAFKRRRCLIPADGFYEWQPRADGPKQPWFIHGADARPLALGGLWERWSGPEGSEILSCTIITTPADGNLDQIHDRMPLILPAAAFERWLDPNLEDRSALSPLLSRNEAPGLRMHPVGRQVNRAANEGPELIRPLAESPGDADSLES